MSAGLLWQREQVPVYGLAGNIFCIVRNSQQKRILRSTFYYRAVSTIFDQAALPAAPMPRASTRIWIQHAGADTFSSLIDDTAHLTYYIAALPGRF